MIPISPLFGRMDCRHDGWSPSSSLVLYDEDDGAGGEELESVMTS